MLENMPVFTAGVLMGSTVLPRMLAASDRGLIETRWMVTAPETSLRCELPASVKEAS